MYAMDGSEVPTESTWESLWLHCRQARDTKSGQGAECLFFHRCSGESGMWDWGCITCSSKSLASNGFPSQRSLPPHHVLFLVTKVQISVVEMGLGFVPVGEIPAGLFLGLLLTERLCWPSFHSV